MVRYLQNLSIVRSSAMIIKSSSLGTRFGDRKRWSMRDLKGALIYVI